ncbi:unnamed protein product [Aureobasidium uvarum]|uniref:Uncharacterized protein n=1 Tax=Aureobasidium uvarum TaxID=2773716 RepID=A0A9N8KIJ2_9PEZI|nr:unnamed protein product [Aureobasidium uvarum]
MNFLKIMDWKPVKVFRMLSSNASALTLEKAESLIAYGRRGSALSEIFSVCGPDTPAAAVIGLGTIVEQDPIPTPEELEALYKMVLMDRTRNKTPFGDLVRASGNRRNIVIFIRHFFCPALAHEMPPEKLEQMDPPTTLSIVGCGDPVLIQNYMKMTNCPFDVYADPSRSTYSALGLSINETAAPDVPQYVSKYSTTSIFKAILISLGLAAKTKNISAGKKSQNGGELIWVDGQIQYIHKMKHTNDHLEVDQLDYLLSNYCNA